MLLSAAAASKGGGGRKRCVGRLGGVFGSAVVLISKETSAFIPSKNGIHIATQL